MTGPPAGDLDRTRTARLDRALADTHARTVIGLPGGEVHRLGPALLTGSRVPLRSMNGVFLYDARGFNTLHDERRLDACLAVASTYDVPWSFNAWAHLGGTVLVEQLSRRGLVIGGRATAMWLDLPPPEGPPPGPTRPATGPAPGQTSGGAPDPSWRVEPVRTPTSATSWARTLLEVFSLEPDLEPALTRLATHPEGPALLGRLHGIPVAAAAAMTSSDIVEVAFVAVRAPWRGRHLGSALVGAAEEQAAGHGASACVALVTPTGMPLFRARGYVPVTSVTFMVPPGRVLSASA